MKRSTVVPIFNCVIAFILLAITQVGLASNSKETIYNTSVDWKNSDGIHTLLDTVPSWDNDVIANLFTAYLHPHTYKLPNVSSKNTFNLQFIHAFWGPLNNAFNKYPRPAKVFVFLNESKKSFYMAPLIQNTSDKNYYIFDKDQTKPVLLTQWVNQLLSAQNKSSAARMNVCVNYGSLPDDTCEGTSYQDELNVSLKNNKTLSVLPPVLSAHRPSTENWHESASRLMKKSYFLQDGIYASSIDWMDQTARKKLLSTTVSWPNLQTIQANFEQLRDIRYFTDTQVKGFMRRLSWLYPDDGCWTRASGVIQDLFGPLNNPFHQFPRPSKVFVFGSLCVNTTNSPQGAVTWWYHTAPIVKDENTNITYVLDPAVNPHKPLTMEAWVNEITSNTGHCAGQSSKVERFNLCNGYGSSPNQSCDSSYTVEAGSVLDQTAYQGFERRRQVKLGRDADAVLGIQPPWLG